jgi:alanine racemase
MRPATAILSRKNLLHNIKIIKEKAPSSKVIAMVKANAYGHGICEVGRILDGNVDMLGVCSIDEALMLRNAGVKAQVILAQGVFDESELLQASCERFHVVFNNDEQLNWLERQDLPILLNSWIKINTGMGRLGFQLENAKSAYLRLLESKKTEKPVRIMSHFACADDASHPLNQRQIAVFREFIKDKNSEYSFCNSGGIMNFPECNFDFVRPGISIYGVSPISGKTAADFGLKPVMTMQSKISSVQKIRKGETIGYNARYKCSEDTNVGIVAIGYGDGYPLTAVDGTPILVNEKECSLVGRVSMDMIAVDLKNCPDAKVGDKVILWGDALPVERVSASSTNISYNTLTGVQSRVKYLWVD